MSTFFQDFVEKIKDEDTHVVGQSAAEFTGWLDTGCYIFNALVSGSIFGGVPNNKITTFAGKSGTGKTFLVLGIVKHFLKNNKNGIVVYYDTEAATTKEMMESRGIDSKRVIVVELETIERFRTHAIKVLDAYNEKEERPPMLIVLDSLGMLSSEKEIGDTAIGKDTKDMTKAQLIRATCRVLTQKLAKAKVPILITNHTYDSIGGYFPSEVMSGGNGIIYASSTIIMLSSKKDKDGNDIVGNIITMKQEKGRVSKRYSKVEGKLSYVSGLDKYYGLLPLAEKYNIVKKISTKYEFPDGRKAFEKAIYADPESYFTQDILLELDKAAQKEFKYGSEETDETDETEVSISDDIVDSKRTKKSSKLVKQE